MSRIYLVRGIVDEQELSSQLGRLYSSSSLGGLDKALGLIYDALVNKQHIMIVGDFDCDGATSTSLAVLALRAMGATKCSYLVPNRFEFGYGLTPQIGDHAAPVIFFLLVVR